jgi:lipopolysaccharide biosynthesis glycosyltransferase
MALPGFGPTISSLLRNCPDSGRMTIWFLCAGLKEEDKINITCLLMKENFKGKNHYIDFNPEEQFGQFNSLHGDWTTYGRLLLPELLINEDSVLYLDADLIIEVDVTTLEGFDFQNNALAALSRSTLRHALDNSFLTGKLGLSPETRYFNCGILFLDLAAWRSGHFKRECLSIAKKYPADLISHDQTLLNAVFGSRFTQLPEVLNCPWYAGKPRPAIGDKMILHFLGSPKPWDIGGKWMHEGYILWKQYLDADWARYYNRFTLKNLGRIWKIRKSYGRALKIKMGK